jgi:hypothetical protein
MEKLLKSTLVSGLALIAMGATIAVASSDLAPGCKQSAGAEPALSIEQLGARLTALGYTRVQEIEREDGCFEVEATDSDNREMELLVHAITGEVLKAEAED